MGRIAVLPIEAANDAAPARDAARALTDQLLATFNSSQIAAVSPDDAKALQGADRDSRLQALDVSLLLSGSVQDDGKLVDVKLRLDDPIHHATLWTGGGSGPAADYAALRMRLAKTAANVLACSSRALKPGGLSDPALLTRYLHACDLFTNQDDADGAANTFQLLSSLRQVIAGAPDFVPARTDLAKFAAYLAPTMPSEAARAMRAEAAQQADAALAIDPRSPDAWLAKELLLPRENWAGREAMLRRGVAIDPDWPHTNGFLGTLLSETGRMKEASTYYARAAAADLQIDWSGAGAQGACQAGDFASTIDELRSKLAADPASGYARGTLRVCLFDAGRNQDACATFVEDESPPTAWWRLLCRAIATNAPADRAAAEQALIAGAGDSPGQRARAIRMLAVLGDVDDAFRLADGITAGNVIDGSLTDYLFYPMTAPLRRDPRFMALAARLKLTDYWRKSGAWPDFCQQPGLPYDCRAEAARLAGGR